MIFNKLVQCEGKLTEFLPFCNKQKEKCLLSENTCRFFTQRISLIDIVPGFDKNLHTVLQWKGRL